MLPWRYLWALSFLLSLQPGTSACRATFIFTALTWKPAQQVPWSELFQELCS